LLDIPAFVSSDLELEEEQSWSRWGGSGFEGGRFGVKEWKKDVRV